jgi:tetratricopeptide (TPR) repeat protein
MIRLFLSILLVFPLFASSVKVWEENVVIPTYLAGSPDPNPMFYFGRAYQGAEGRVYPYALYDKLTGKRVDKTWRMVYLENEYVKIGVLPEIGGRIFSARDKTNGYDFFYRQHVIKPALIGMLGAWISGGVEWNIPHHHRASSFLPVQHHLEENADGSRTVWVGELELRHRMRWAVGLTLHPGKSYVEATFRILNRTPLANTVLAWSNVAVHTNENYQVIFPPRTQFGTHHAKREFIAWPKADSFYGGSDFRGGVDVAWWKNHTFGNSIFAWNYEDDFLAGYDHGKQAGTLSVADRHVVPGKKLWTWGTGPGGRLWDKILSDEDGPYIELMVGAWSDNQPDYSWVQPYEVKDWKQYWYPYRDIGGVKNANLDAAVNLDVAGGTAAVGFCTTTAHKQAVALLKAGDKVLMRETIAIEPGKPFFKTVAAPAGEKLRASLEAGGRELVAYTPVEVKPEPMPKPVTPPPPPAEIKTNEELYLAGLRIEQFHNPSLEPDPYWEEALRRDPGDARVNTAVGVSLLKRGRFDEAEARLRAAAGRLSANYTTPKDGEPYYYLGVALKAQGRTDEAFDAFYKAIWSVAWQAPGYHSLAEIASMRGDYAQALEFTERSLRANALNTRALNLKASMLRHLGRSEEAIGAARAASAVDPLDMRAMAERWLASKGAAPSAFAEHPATARETAVEYANAGLWKDASAVLSAVPGDALACYYLAYFAEKQGADPAEYYRKAFAAPPELVFPFQQEAISVLRRAMEANPKDARAPYYLGTLLFDWQPAEAIRLWETSRSLDPSFPIVHRNLAAAYARQENALDKAIASLEKAVALGTRHAIHFFELDQLYEAAGVSPEKRLATLEKHHAIVVERDDALAREVALKVNMGKYDEALALMHGRRFNVWEGGARFSVHDYWTDAHLLRGHRRLAAGQAKEALADYQAALEFPENLQVARFRRGGRHPEIMYWIGTAHDALGDTARARESWKEAAAELPKVGGDDILPTTDRTVLLYYQALALARLGDKGRAAALFEQLVRSGQGALAKKEKVDFFAKFGEAQTERARVAQAHYISGLGYSGLGDQEKARQAFQKALEASPDHLGAKTLLAGRVQ